MWEYCPLQFFSWNRNFPLHFAERKGKVSISAAEMTVTRGCSSSIPAHQLVCDTMGYAQEKKTLEFTTVIKYRQPLLNPLWGKNLQLVLTWNIHTVLLCDSESLSSIWIASKTKGKPSLVIAILSTPKGPQQTTLKPGSIPNFDWPRLSSKRKGKKLKLIKMA